MLEILHQNFTITSGSKVEWCKYNGYLNIKPNFKLRSLQILTVQETVKKLLVGLLSTCINSVGLLRLFSTEQFTQILSSSLRS